MEDLISIFAEFSSAENIDPFTLTRVIEDVFLRIVKRQYGINDNVSIVINGDRGDFKIIRTRTIIQDEDFTDHRKEIMLSRAKQIEPDCEVGEDLDDEIKLSDFTPDAFPEAREFLLQSILEIQKEQSLTKYNDYIGHLISGKVISYQHLDAILLNDFGDEMLLHRADQIPGETFHIGECIKAILVSVNINNNKSEIIVSRVHKHFLVELLNFAIAEIFHGLIQVEKYARIPGVKSKVVVVSMDRRLDPISVCVGKNGYKVRAIKKELPYETLDFIPLEQDNELFIQKLLAPAVIRSISYDADTDIFQVVIDPDQLSLLQGPGGANLSLASVLLGKQIDVFLSEEVPP